MRGTTMTNGSRCGTSNRVVVHTGGAIHDVSVCPKPPIDFRHHVVEVFSDGWAVGSNAMILGPGEDLSRTIALEFIGKEAGSHSVSWLELERRPHLTTPLTGLQRPRDFEQRCPELVTYINGTLMRRSLPLFLGLQRSVDALFDAAEIAIALPGSGFSCTDTDNRCIDIRHVEDMLAEEESIDFAAQIEEHLVGDSDNQWERSDMLTKR